jgi:hypothetical protein
MAMRPGEEDWTIPSANTITVRSSVETAGLFARCGSVLVSLTTGGALALAQYASLADGDPAPLERLALVLVVGGAAVALLAWGWLAVAKFRQRRAESAPRPINPVLGCSYFLWLLLMSVGFLVMAAGGNADSTGPLALAALGFGCAGAIGGLLGFLQVCWHWLTDDLRRGREVQAALRAAAVAEGRELLNISRAVTVLCALGALASAVVLIGVASIAPWLAAAVQLPTFAVLAGLTILGMVICAPTLSVFVYASTVNSEPVPLADARAYSYRSGLVATLGLALIGILPAFGLGLFSIGVFFGLAYVANRLRRRYLVRA